MSLIALDLAAKTLVVSDGPMVLVHETDGDPRWQRTLEADVVAVATDGARVYAVDVEGSVALFAAKDGVPCGKARAVAPKIAALNPQAGAFFGDGVLDLLNSTRGVRVPLAGDVTAAAWSPSGAELLAAVGESLVFMDAEGIETKRIALPGTASALAVHPDGAAFVAVGDAVFRVADGAAARFTGKKGSKIDDLAVSSDGKLLAIGMDGAIALTIELATKDTAASLSYVDRTVRGVAFGGPRTLGIALDKGDANLVPLTAGKPTVYRTDPPDGRERNRWLIKTGFEEPVLRRLAK